MGEDFDKNAGVSWMVQWFKTMTTNEYIRLVKMGKLPRFEKRIWQRNYYEHIIRNRVSYGRIKKYIRDNVKNWGEGVELDCEGIVIRNIIDGTIFNKNLKYRI